MRKQNLMHKPSLVGLFRLFRFELPFTAGVCVFLGELLALGQIPPARTVVLGFFSVFLISATALILNDYFDLESDKINAPTRPLPAGLVTKQEVVLLSSLVTILGFLFSILISFQAFLVVVLVWVIGFLYNWRLKQTGLIGNLMVSFSVGMTFIFGGIAVGQPLEKAVWFFAILAGLLNLGEELAADAMDLEGDRVAGSRSLPVLVGREHALKLSGAIFFFVIALSLLPFLSGWMEWVYGLPLLFMDGVILYATLKLWDPRGGNQRTYIRWIYLSALGAILIFIAIRMAR